jgi:hypothetical protein
VIIIAGKEILVKSTAEVREMQGGDDGKRPVRRQILS